MCEDKLRELTVMVFCPRLENVRVLANVPPKEDLCGMIVDRKVEKRCLQCFSWAGHISQREEKFVSQASQGLKYIMKSTLVDHGAPTILSVQAMASILQLPGIKHLARESVSACRDKYISERHWKNDMREETEEQELEDLMEFESGAGAMLLETVMHDDFFLPVPEWLEGSAWSVL
ncbi:hypothetical protein GWK47_009808 [Chionoecetes opilio]|uniref:Uncharacterized protein n=1 Tax=Chionoecetes opilio TaxID=41210 RepID=A0A8J4Y434_CHIOP|nr:hypothetical protein GWK47_009808 [Chionoecetes opilio]